LWRAPDETYGFEVQDKRAGFVVRGYGPIAVGDDYRHVFPRD
jgi:hypothetical protein